MDNKLLWEIDYVVGNTYKKKYVTATTSQEALDKAKIKNIVDINISKTHFREEQYDALIRILTTGQLKQEDVELLDCSKMPLIYQDDNYFADITLEDLFAKHQFTIDIYSYLNDKTEGEWIFTLLNLDNINDVPKTYTGFMALLDNKFLHLDEEFVKSYRGNYDTIEHDKDITDD